MPGIFISYRREDTAGHAGRIFDRLRETFGRDKVFMDVAAIEPGVDFVEAIDRAVGSCDVLLVIIGRQWLSCRDAAGRNRLDDPRDFIRLETATALRRNIRVIPVLVQGAAMPGEGDLPDDLKKLARRQAIEISDTHWDASFEQLVETVEKVLAEATKPVRPGASETARAVAPTEQKPEAATPGPVQRGMNRRIGIIAAATALLAVLAALLFTMGPDKVEVPGLLGLSLDEAVQQLEEAKLRPGTIGAVPSQRPPGSVIEQDPSPGSALAPKSAVSLVIAEAEPEAETAPEVAMAEVPGLVGQSLESAFGLLERVGLRGVKAAQKETRDAPEGTVVEQVPAAGTRLPREETVELVVAVRPADPGWVTVPDVTGLEVKRAVSILQDAGLSVVPRIEGVETAEAAPGTVLRQSLKPGSRVRASEAISLVHALAPRDDDASGQIELPDFTRSPVRKAEAFLRESGLVIGSIQERPTRDHPAGTVLAQRPPGKTRVVRGAQVNLLVAASPGGSVAVLPAPQQTLPRAGQAFDNFPRTTALRWQPVAGAVGYVVELDCLHCCVSGKWCAEVGRPWKLVRDIPAVASPGYKFEFVGAQPGRWRVWAVDANGREGEKSPWRTFRYTR